jgi:glycosyltransferase involved in cell wall biosynthesis
VSAFKNQVGRFVRGVSRRVRRPVAPTPQAAPAQQNAPAAQTRARPARSPESEELRALIEADRYPEALEKVRDQLESRATDVHFLRHARQIAHKCGEISLQRRATELEVAGWPTESNQRLLRLQNGRLLDTDPAWTPTIAADVEPAAGRERRILHVLKQSLPHRQSGYSVRSMYVLQGQRQAGLDPVAVTALDFPEPGAAPEDEVANVRHLRLLRDVVPEREATDAYLDGWATALAPVVAAERPEIIHVHSGHRGYDAARVALAVGEAMRVPVVYEVRGFFESLWSADERFNESSERYRRQREIEAHCMRQAAAVVTLSESMKQDIVARGIDPAKVTVVPNGVDTASFSPREPSSELRERWNLTGFVFGYVSNLDHYREGQELLIEAALKLRAEGIEATALIVGDGARREVLEEHADKLHAGDAVVFTGRVPHDEVLDYYALMDVFVVPRVNERAARLVTPLKPYEAMALGVPLVVSDLPALDEITGGGSRGRSFVTGDSADLARVLGELANDHAAGAALATEALDWVRRERDWSRNGERYRELYRSLLAG